MGILKRDQQGIGGEVGKVFTAELFQGGDQLIRIALGNGLREIGITCENHGSYLMERYWFDVFELQ